MPSNLNVNLLIESNKTLISHFPKSKFSKSKFYFQDSPTMSASEPRAADPHFDADELDSSDELDTDLDADQNPNPNNPLPETPDLERSKIDDKKPQSQNTEESRRLFQRLWTDDDEIKILKGFLEFTSSRGTTFASHQYDTGPFYDQIKNELDLEFNKNQLIEKLRRLKKKYRNTANRMAAQGSNFSFKSPHERDTYDIAKKIWSASVMNKNNSDDEDFSNVTDALVASDKKATGSRTRRRSRKRNLDDLSASPMLPVDSVVKVEVQNVAVESTPLNSSDVKVANNGSVSGVIEETVKSCISPIFKELMSTAVAGNGCFGLGPLGLNLPPLLNFGSGLGDLMEGEKWKKQRILEMEVYLKRVELVREHIKLSLEELKGSKVEPDLES